MTSAEENKALVRRMEDEIFNKRNVAAVDEFLSPGYAVRTAPEGMPNDRDAARGYMAMYIDAFPDLRVSVDQLLAVDDKVVAVLTYAGTHERELFGIPATGKRVSVRQIAIYRIEDGKVAEEWEVSDQLGLMQQIGAIPAE